MDGIGLPQVGLGSGWAAFLVVMFLVARGQLIPRRTHEDIVGIKDQQLAEKDKQLGELAEVGRAVDAVMRAIQQGAASADREVP